MTDTDSTGEGQQHKFVALAAALRELVQIPTDEDDEALAPLEGSPNCLDDLNKVDESLARGSDPSILDAMVDG